MNQYPLWKYLLLVVVIAVGVLYSSPNLYGEDPAVQVSAERGAVFDESLDNRIRSTLSAAGITPKSLVREQGRVLVRFDSGDDQLKGADALRAELARGYIVALNLAPTTPDWMTDIGALPMYLGLDLRGGVHFLMEVDMTEVITKSLEDAESGFRTSLREEGIRYRGVKQVDDHIDITFRDEDTLDKAEFFLRNQSRDLTFNQIDDLTLRAIFAESKLQEIRDNAVKQNITIIRNRVNQLGVAEPLVQKQGADRIVVQLPVFKIPLVQKKF